MTIIEDGVSHDTLSVYSRQRGELLQQEQQQLIQLNSKHFIEGQLCLCVNTKINKKYPPFVRLCVFPPLKP